MKTSGTGTLERYVMHNMSPIKAMKHSKCTARFQKISTPEFSKLANQETESFQEPWTLHRVGYSRPGHSFWTFCQEYWNRAGPLNLVKSLIWQLLFVDHRHEPARVKKCLFAQNCGLWGPTWGPNVQLSSSGLWRWVAEAVRCWFHHHLKGIRPWNCKLSSNRLRSSAPLNVIRSLFRHYLHPIPL